MSRFMVVGSEAFTLGFKLAGVNDLLNVNETTAEKEIKKILNDKPEGIMVIDDKTFDWLSTRTRHKVEDSVTPVAVILSEKAEQETIRRMILKAIGIDIMQKK